MSEANIQENTEGALPARRDPHHLRRAVIIWAVLSIIGIVAVVFLAPLVLPVAADDIDAVDNGTLVFFTALAVPVALFVFVFLGYSVLAFRVKEQPTEGAVPLQPTTGLQIGWLGITGLLCLFLVIWGLFASYQQTVAAPANPLVVQVTGQQWLWNFNYPEYGASTQGQLIELPVNRPVVFEVTSKDVLHGFAIRSLGIRVDANPGQVTTTTIVTPSRIGSYSVACVELCGLYHSYMWSSVDVVSSSSFNSWIVSQGGHL
ncbi:cytochrome c oxidase subunit II [Dictyobacter kobayashii]|uniref:cytochrome-c oxidase n=1 Tax=Dictyobacter kobayashii TaxID=2014872 RepID=A0A402AP18_9CHLR|nr:cytochrome c oxidase subunit II [Dictyobacter kobayashii]GCE20774.1 cytochrome c oxidase subunit 2 [Dictyobacter kobayashii]